MKHLLPLVFILLPNLLQAGGSSSSLNHCKDCHRLNEQFVGPAFTAVAARYKGDPEAPAFLAKNIKHGVKGKWGNSRHPALAITEKKAMKYALAILAIQPEAPKAAEKAQAE